MKTLYIIAIIIVGLVLAVKIVHWFLIRRIVFKMMGDSPMFFANSSNEQIKAAMDKAVEEVDSFIEELEKTSGDFEGSVKVKVEDGKDVEYMWLDNLSYENEVFSGSIGNDPQFVKNVKCGDDWQVGRNDIYDWMYMKEDKFYGNFTFKASLDKLPPEKKLQALGKFGDVDVDELKKEFVTEHCGEMGPMISALADSMTPDMMIETIENMSISDEKKQEMVKKIREKTQERS